MEAAKEVMRRRDGVEREIQDILQSLEAEQVGENGSLVDKEGFPRSDIDVHSIRLERNRLAMLKQDHKHLTDEIEAKIAAIHAEARARKAT